MYQKIDLQKYMNQKVIEMKGDVDNSTIMARDFNTSLSTIHETTRHKIQIGVKETQHHHLPMGIWLAIKDKLLIHTQHG